MARILNTRLVALAEGLAKPSTLIWKGTSRKAPEMPTMLVQKLMAKAARGGSQSQVSTPETGNWCQKKSFTVSTYRRSRRVDLSPPRWRVPNWARGYGQARQAGLGEAALRGIAAGGGDQTPRGYFSGVSHGECGSPRFRPRRLPQTDPDLAEPSDYSERKEETS
jgi:hypothetical protein